MPRRVVRGTILIIAVFIKFNCLGQGGSILKSTIDLDFLIGSWKAEMTYNPKQEDERILSGTINCESVLSNQYIKCIYNFERPGKLNSINDVYYNYNSIYDLYESIWMSSTWPVKVLLQGDLRVTDDSVVLSTNAEFPIGEGVNEYVKDVLVFDPSSQNNYYRDTYIRTSKDTADIWRHHSREKAVLINK